MKFIVRHILSTSFSIITFKHKESCYLPLIINNILIKPLVHTKVSDFSFEDWDMLPAI